MRRNLRTLYYTHSSTVDLQDFQDNIDSILSNINAPKIVKVDSSCTSYHRFRLVNHRDLARNPWKYHKHTWSLYVKPVAHILNALSSSKIICVAVGDNTDDYQYPVVAKTRPRNSTNVTIIRLNLKRHWNYIDIIDSQDAPWSSKTDIVFWRGATTGKWNRTISPDPRSARCNLAHLLLSTSFENVDIGFTKIVQGFESTFKSIDLKARNESIFRPAVPISEHLKHKYILSLEGNDIATNLKWILASSSVPLMPIPSCESWGMEFLLKPWQHFVPICHDLSDLEIKISWCRDHEKAAQQIGIEGQRYMRMFLNQNKEIKIESSVIRQSMLRA